jgi:Uma2 family endonuclease
MNKPATIDVHSAKPFDERHLTVRDIDRMIAHGELADARVELVGGVLERMSPAHGNHGSHHVGIGAKLWHAYQESDYFVASELAVKTGDATVRGVDIAVVRNSAPRDRIITASDIILAVEIADTTLERDLNEKQPEYALAGIPEYWVVDINAATVHVMRDLADGIYREKRAAPFGTDLAPPSSPVTIQVT